jgi:spermidine synthase
MTIDVVDIDPVVVEMARKYFGFREDAFMHVAIADGRRFIEKCKEPYDIIFLDAYGTNNIPYDLTTKEFLQAVRRALGPQGVVAANIWSSSYNRLFGEMLRTYQEVFDDLSLIDLRDNTSQIFLARPCLGSVNRADLAGRASRLSKEKRLRFDLGGYVWWGFRQANAKNSRVPVLLDKDKRRSQGGSICPHRRRSDSIDVHSSTILVAATVCLRIMSHDSPDGRHGLC